MWEPFKWPDKWMGLQKRWSVDDGSRLGQLLKCRPCFHYSLVGFALLAKKPFLQRNPLLLIKLTKKNEWLGGFWFPRIFWATAGNGRLAFKKNGSCGVKAPLILFHTIKKQLAWRGEIPLLQMWYRKLGLLKEVAENHIAWPNKWARSLSWGRFKKTNGLRCQF